MEKAALRIKYSAIRDAIEERSSKSSEIIQKFLDSDIYKNAENIILYYSIDSEVETLKLLDKLLKDKSKNIFLPFLDSIEIGQIKGPMDVLGIKVRNNVLRIPKEVFKEKLKSAVVVVPGLAFTEDGFRLGQGSGWYDKFLSNHTDFLKIGFAFDEQIIQKLPIEKTDVALDIIITPTKLIKISDF